MSEVKKGDKVKVHYTGKLNDGTIFDSSIEREPLEFTIGSAQVIPGFENGVLGMKINDKKRIEIPCAEAYGDAMDAMIGQIPKDQFPEHITPEVGLQLQIPQENGQVIPATITAVSETEVTLDANHPLAGKDLIFELELVEIL